MNVFWEIFLIVVPLGVAVATLFSPANLEEPPKIAPYMFGVIWLAMCLAWPLLPVWFIMRRVFSSEFYKKPA